MIIMIFHSSCPSNNDNSIAFFFTVLSESDIQFGESNVSKKSICTLESGRQAPSIYF